MKLLNYIKENKLFMSVMMIGIVIFSIQTSLVVMYADDLSLGIISKTEGFIGAFPYMKTNYLTWGGGPTPMFAIMFLCFDIVVWKIFSIVIVSLSVFFIVDMVCYKNKKNRWWMAALIWLSLFIIDIAISRETLYWLDGHLAYVFTAFNLLIYFYYLFRRIIMKTSSRKYDYIFLPILAFFAGWSGPQSGSIILVMTLLLFLYERFVNKNKIKKIYYISFLIAISGFLFYFLAPGNKVRLEVGFPEISKYNIIELILYRVDSVFSLFFNYPLKFAGLYFFVLISYCAILIISLNYLKYNKIKNKFWKGLMYISCVTLIMYLLAFAIYKFELIGNEYIYKLLFRFKNLYGEIIAGTFKITMLIPYILNIIVVFLSIIDTLYISLTEKKPLLFIAMSCAFLSQFIMLDAPYSPLRTLFLPILLFILGISQFIFIIKEKKYNIEIISFTILIYFGINYLIFGLICYLIIILFSKKEITRYIFALLVVLYFSMVNVTDMLKGYYYNKKINIENVNILESYDGISDEVKLHTLYDESYGFNKMVGIEWIENSVREYYDIPNSVKLIEE